MKRIDPVKAVPQAIVGLGAGGHAAVMIETFRATGGWEIIGLIAPSSNCILDVPVVGDDDILATLPADGIGAAFLAVGMMGCTERRRSLVELAQQAGLMIVGVIHPSAVVVPSARIDPTAQVMAGAIIQSRVALREHSLVNTGAIVDHDCYIEPFAHVATGARLCGGVHLGAGAWVGAGATVIQGITIGEGAIVGAGAVVTKDVLPKTKVVGVPAKVIPAESVSTVQV